MNRVPIIAALVAIAIAGCTNKNAPGEGQKQEAVKFPVEVQSVEIAGVQYSVEAVGSVDAFEQVAVTARVTGVVDRVNFTEGSRVGAGQRLVEIDRRTYTIGVMEKCNSGDRQVLRIAAVADGGQLANRGLPWIQLLQWKANGSRKRFAG